MKERPRWLKALGWTIYGTIVIGLLALAAVIIVQGVVHYMESPHPTMSDEEIGEYREYNPPPYSQ